MRVVHTPRLSPLMRSTSMPYLQKPLVAGIRPVEAHLFTPWYERSGMGAFELPESAQPRANPAFSDTYVIGASGGANRVYPQGVDYSRLSGCGVGCAAMGFFEAVPNWAWLLGAAVAGYLGYKAYVGSGATKTPF